ncbi:hypothetical protein ACERNI_17720 [Camelimonas sp. ID_303_24]
MRGGKAARAGSSAEIGAEAARGARVADVDAILRPGGKDVGHVHKRASSYVRTVHPSEFNKIKTQLLLMGQKAGSYTKGDGTRYDLASGRGGFRIPKKNGPAIDIDIDIDIPRYKNGYKDHQSE